MTEAERESVQVLLNLAATLDGVASEAMSEAGRRCSPAVLLGGATRLMSWRVFKIALINLRSIERDLGMKGERYW